MKYVTLCNIAPAWNGWQDEITEGIWTSVDKPTKYLLNQTFQPWTLGQPDGSAAENCAAIAKKGWSDKPCSDLQCAICDKPTNLSFLLRGIYILHDLKRCWGLQPIILWFLLMY